MAEDELTPEEREQIKEYLGYGSSVSSEKHNVHTFLHNVATAEDTTKLGNLSEDELGVMINPVRSFKHLALFSGDIMKKEGLRKFFEANAEIGTSTSLSKGALLVKLAVTQKREVADVTKERKKNAGWFKKKEKTEDNTVEQ